MSTLNDVKHVLLNAQYEIKKQLRRRRILLAVFFSTCLPLLYYLIPLALNREFPDEWDDFARRALGFVNLLVITCVALFAGDAISGEIEKKTALISYTSPQRRTSIFIGKYLAASILTIGMVSAYYFVVLCEIGRLYGFSIDMDLLNSYLLAVLYGLGVGGLTFFFSSIFRSTIVSTLTSFFTLFLALPIISVLLEFAKIRPWYLITFGAQLITGIFGMEEIVLPELNVVFYVPNYTTTVAVMCAYALIFLFLALLISSRRQIE